jgi:26S proteasome regulatory subunit N1
MAGDSDLPKSADKGKAKAVDDVKKPEELKKDKDGKLIPNGKKDDDNNECLSSSPHTQSACVGHH